MVVCEGRVDAVQLSERVVAFELFAQPFERQVDCQRLHPRTGVQTK